MSFTLPATPKRERLIGSLMNRDFPGVSSKDQTYAASFLRIKTEPRPDQLVLDACKHRETLESLAEDELEARLERHSKPADKEQQLFLNRAESVADQATWDHWTRMATWTSPQATALSLDRKPERVTLQIAHKFQEQSTFARAFIARHDLIHNAIISGTLLVTRTTAESGIYPPLIAPENLVLWANHLGLDVPGAIKGLVEDQGGPQTFKEIKNLNWENVTLTLLSGGHIEASTPVLTKKVPLADMGLINRTTNKPNTLFTLLTDFAKSRQGTLEINSKPKDHAYGLRKELKAFFPITSNPISAEGRYWVPRFNLIDKRDAPDKRAKEKALRKTVTFDENNLAHQLSSETVSGSNLSEYPYDDESGEAGAWLKEKNN